MNDENNPKLFSVTFRVMNILRRLPDDDARLRVVRAAAILLNVDLAAVDLQEIER